MINSTLENINTNSNSQMVGNAETYESGKITKKTENVGKKAISGGNPNNNEPTTLKGRHITKEGEAVIRLINSTLEDVQSGNTDIRNFFDQTGFRVYKKSDSTQPIQVDCAYISENQGKQKFHLRYFDNDIENILSRLKSCNREIALNIYNALGQQ